MAFTPNKAVIKQMASIRGAGDVQICLQDEQYYVRGDHTGAHLQAIATPNPTNFQLPIITWIGTEVSGYASNDLKAFIGRKSNDVQLAVYGNQLEQIGVEGQGAPYTFTPGMGLIGCSRSEPSSSLLEKALAWT